ncbi:MATE family efflux transporter [Halomarina litorea]|uniref:MATE family efflux transporter n=1 Tax=Halomarina litorea TaxID=2961595 RepID=UPI0034A4E3E8
MAEQTFRTLMRTTDILVTASISPVAVAAIGLADLYARFPLWIGLGFGGGAISLSSQDTGAAVPGGGGTEEAARAASANRDQAISVALVVGALLGLPFVAFGLLFGREAIAVLGAPAEVATVGGAYLAVVFLTAPARHVGLVAARSLQGTGDTRTPMYVNVVANLLNISGSLVLGWGLFGAPELGVVGVGVATSAANVLTAGALLGALWGPWAAADLVRPSDPVVARQLVEVSLPAVAEGLASTLAEFPFNAVLLGFGTAVNAAFQVGRRMYQQVTGPLGRGYNVAVSVVVGQALGRGDPAAARFDGWASAALGVVSVGGVGLLLAAGAPLFVGVFTTDSETVRYAVDFARVYGLSAPFLATFTVLQGALRGAGETRVPFVARTTGTYGFLVAFTYLAGVVGGLGVLGAYLGIALSYVWMALVVGVSFGRGDWAGRAARLLSERGSLTE